MKTDFKQNVLQTCLLAAPLLALPAVVLARFIYTTSNGTTAITKYSGLGGTVIDSTLTMDLTTDVAGLDTVVTQYITPRPEAPLKCGQLLEAPTGPT
jgi:hypothetical protein